MKSDKIVIIVEGGNVEQVFSSVSFPEVQVISIDEYTYAGTSTEEVETEIKKATKGLKEVH